MKTINEEGLKRISPYIQFKHPNYLLRDIFKISKQVGAKSFLNSPEFDSERDILIACMFSYGIRLLEEREWFLQRGNNPPDFNMVAMTNRKLNDKPVDYAQVEIVQVPPSFGSSLEAYEMIRRKKLQNYALEVDDILLIFINHHEGPRWSEELKDFLGDYKGNFKRIWVIYLVKVSLEESFIYVVKNIKPGGDTLQLSLKEEFLKGLVYKNDYLDKLGVKVI